MSLLPEYASHDALGLAQLVRERQVTPLELVDAAIERIEALNPALNAVIHTMDDQARLAAKGALPEGPFRGVPFLVKDLISTVAGVPFRCGSRFLRDYRPATDSELIRRYRAAGLIITGKTNTPEFGLTPFTEPERFGPTRNPWNTGRTPGGSSGGSAAAVASGMVPMAGGGDGGGSIRIPASCCGLFGLKPSRGRVPTGPGIGEIWQGAVVEGVLTRSVRDTAALLDAVQGPDLGAPYWAPPPARPFLSEVGADPGRLRIAFTTKPMMGRRVDPVCVQAVEDTARLLESLGHTVEEAAPGVDGPALARAFMTMLCGELRGDITDAENLLGRRATPGDFEPATWALALLGDQLTAAEFVQAVRLMERTTRQVAPFFAEWDMLLTPTLASPPVLIGSLQPTAAERLQLTVLGRLRAGRLLRLGGVLQQAADEVFEFIPWTPVFNVTGQPAMSVPLCWSPDGLPIGMHLVGQAANEAALLRLASQLEQARPWFARTPPTFAA
ncbi:MAG TPA: amidase [Gemmatimonadales bacterium]|nr:amidase [Gemmatimonadales bacterium]